VNYITERSFILIYIDILRELSREEGTCPTALPLIAEAFIGS
jgi:hypothetical protein